MQTQPQELGRAPLIVRIAAYASLVLFGIGLGLGVLEIAMRLDPQIVPAEVSMWPPVRRYIPSEDKWFDIRESDGDLFYKAQGDVKPIAPADDQVLARVHLVTDHAGFRNPEPWRPRYDIAILGDSFTYVTAPTPWPEQLSQLTQKTVLNLGQLGIGPLEERDLFTQYGRDKSPQWVIIAYFEGNDLNDVASYAKAEPLLIRRVYWYFRAKLSGSTPPVGTGLTIPPSSSAQSVEYQYPFQAVIGGHEQPVALLNFYVSWLSVGAQEIEASQNLHLARDAFATIRDESKNSGTRMLIVYVPSKERLFVSESRDRETLTRILRNVSSIALDKSGFLTLQNQPVAAEAVLDHIDDQEKVIEKLASDVGAEFLDLTPCFKRHIDQGALLYYEFDTHWNQAGHDLAAQTIADYLAKGASTCR